jgi:hypothetical protein
MLLIAQIALGVIIGGLTIALSVTGFAIWNSRQKRERLAIGFLSPEWLLYWCWLLWLLLIRKAL